MVHALSVTLTMTEENKTEKPVVIAEALIQTAIGLGQQQDMKLVELIGHMEIAKMEVFSRNIKAAEQLASQPDAPAEGDDKVVKMDAAPAVTEDKA